MMTRTARLIIAMLIGALLGVASIPFFVADAVLQDAPGERGGLLISGDDCPGFIRLLGSRIPGDGTSTDYELQTTTLDEGRWTMHVRMYRITESAMGIVETIQWRFTHGDLLAGTEADFGYGEVDEDVITWSKLGEDRGMEEWPQGTLGPAGIARRLREAGFESGTRTEMTVYVPGLGAPTPGAWVVKGREKVKFSSGELDLVRIDRTYEQIPDAIFPLWVDDEGKARREIPPVPGQRWTLDWLEEEEFEFARRPYLGGGARTGRRFTRPLLRLAFDIPENWTLKGAQVGPAMAVTSPSGSSSVGITTAGKMPSSFGETQLKAMKFLYGDYKLTDRMIAGLRAIQADYEKNARIIVIRKDDHFWTFTLTGADDTSRKTLEEILAGAEMLE